MQLTRLDIKGFKSFGDKITINFNEGVTAIVGPNGCGKSNVVDAIRWVLGEQSTRMLRSEKMENIIFNGTKSRKPSNLAEVSLTFDNTRNILPTEFSQVTITRKLYRTGESEYRLNDVQCRLKDITDLFLDTGIGADLTELRRTVEALDPKGASKPRKLLGIIPFGNTVDRYFDKYRSSQTHISRILGSLANGKDELLMDNAAIDTERAGLWKTMHKLEQMVHISKSLDKQLEDKAAELDATDPAKAKAIRESALFYTRQRTTDLLTQTAVTVQGYLALDLVKKNNVELVKGVDRASTTTVSALRTAVTVAQAMTNQKLVLQQITALNTTTAGMIDSTGEMLRTQTGAIHEQAASSTIPLETLQRAFQNIYETMDQIDRFKLQALDNMKQTVNTLSSEVEKSKGYIARAEGVNQAKLEGATSPLTPIESK